MPQGLEKLLESGILGEETKVALEEAWKAKLDEVRASLREEVENELREEIETQVYESMKARYDHDRSLMLDSMDAMLTDLVNKVNEEKATAVNALNEERAQLTSAIKEARASYEEKLQARVAVLEKFVVQKLKQEIDEFYEDRKAVDDLRVKLATEISSAKAETHAVNERALAELTKSVTGMLSEKVAELNTSKAKLDEAIENANIELDQRKKELSNEVSKRVNTLESFVAEKLKKELAELDEAKTALVEARVKLLSESKRKMEETRKAFIERASKLVESTVQNQLRSELSQLKEDIMEARQNMLGMRIFETFKAEFMTGFISEKSEIKSLMQKLEETNSALEQVKTQIVEKDEKINSLSRKIKIAETNANRVNKMNELLSPLNKESRAIMEEILTNVKTENLHEAFNKYLPTVLNGTKVNAQGRRTLSETALESSTKKTVITKEVTGDRKNILAETADAKEATDDEIARIRRLAGLQY